MAHMLTAVRHVRTSFDNYWPLAVIGFGLTATVAWTVFLGYFALSLVQRLAIPLVESLTH